MAITILATKAKAGRSYKVDNNGPTDVSAKYQVVLSAPMDIDELPTSFTDVPAIGSAHPSRPGFYVLSYEVSQPSGTDKATLDITVHYGPADITIDPLDPTVIETVTEWGWDDGTGEKELVASADATPKPVVNSAGDPFESVPQVSIPTPTFTKVIRSSVRKTGYSAYLCTINDAQITIGDMTCAAGTLLCTIAERKLIGEEKFPYEYTVHLRYRSNQIVDHSTHQTKEIGWNVGILDAGMRELDSTTGKPKLIQVVSEETGQPATVTSPALLDGNGHKRDATLTNYPPVILEFTAYKSASFPAWFYSEPPTPGQSNTNNGGGNS